MIPMLSRSLASSSSRNLASSSRKISTHDRIRGAFFGALVSDALSLGSHYEYDAPKIKQAYGGTISKYMAPGEMMGGTDCDHRVYTLIDPLPCDPCR